MAAPDLIMGMSVKRSLVCIAILTIQLTHQAQLLQAQSTPFGTPSLLPLHAPSTAGFGSDLRGYPVSQVPTGAANSTSVNHYQRPLPTTEYAGQGGIGVQSRGGPGMSGRVPYMPAGYAPPQTANGPLPTGDNPMAGTVGPSWASQRSVWEGGNGSYPMEDVSQAIDGVNRASVPNDYGNPYLSDCGPCLEQPCPEVCCDPCCEPCCVPCGPCMYVML